MSTRDELGYRIAGETGLNHKESARIASELIAEGWRKKPSREEVARWVWKRRIGPNGDESFDYLIARAARGVEGVPEGIWDEADAILALMDRGLDV